MNNNMIGITPPLRRSNGSPRGKQRSKPIDVDVDYLVPWSWSYEYILRLIIEKIVSVKGYTASNNTAYGEIW